MANKYFLLLLFTLFAFNAGATHYRGASLTFRITGNLEVEATLTTYTKISYPSNLADRDSITISWGDATTSLVYRTNGPINENGFPGGVLVGTDIKQNVYTAVHQYDVPTQSLYYVISFFDINLMGDILNINDGNSIEIPIYVEDSVYLPGDLSQIGLNSSPIFLNMPVYPAEFGDTFSFNPCAYDADGDSLYFKLTTPLQAHGSPVPYYLLPTQVCQSGGSNITLDPATGQLDWSGACEIGSFNIAYEVYEYRCGFLIGTVQQQMQITVNEESYAPPALSPISDTILKPGDSIALKLISIDPGVGDTDYLAAYGGAFLAPHNHPVFTYTAGNRASGLFTWRPDTSFVHYNAYIFTFVATNNNMAYGPDGNLDPYPLSDTKSMRIWIADTVSNNCYLQNSDTLLAGIFPIRYWPNPAADMLHIESGDGISSIHVYDLTGSEVESINTFCNQCEVPVNNLNNGVYLLRTISGNTSTTFKFTKIN